MPLSDALPLELPLQSATSFSRAKVTSSLGGLHSTDVAFLLFTQQPQVRFSVFSKNYLDVAEMC